MNPPCSWFGKAWRLLATALGFSVFGLGALLLTTVVFPVLFLTPRKGRSVKARWCIHKSFAFFLWLLQALGVMRFEVHGRELLSWRTGGLLLANHPTLIDVVALIALVPNASCVVKRALWKNPFLGGVVRMADYISNAQPEQLIDACVSDLQRGNPLVIFPEGTRTAPNRPLSFQRGAAYVALKGGCPVQPILIQCDPITLGKGVPWYNIPGRRFTLSLTILPVLNAQPDGDVGVPTTLQARRFTAALETFFMDKLNNGK